MKINKTHKSPNFDETQIPVEFVVIHYTACDLKSTLNILTDENKKVSSHLVLAEDGEFFELVSCLDEVVHKAWHAGKSNYNDGNKIWEGFNDFSIGIEVVNLNGNVFDYTEKQYQSLCTLINHLKTKHKALGTPDRIIGHEQIAGFRGKVDPGWNFNWERIYSGCYPGAKTPLRKPNLPHELRESSLKFSKNLPENQAGKDFWQSINTSMEEASKLANQKGE